MKRGFAWQRAGVRCAALGVLAALIAAASGGPSGSATGAEAARLGSTAASASAAAVADPPGIVWRLPAGGGGDGGRVVDGIGGEAVGPDWQATEVGGPVTHVRLSSGAVYAVTAEAGGAAARLWRGDERGSAWRELASPAARIADLAVHPQDDRVLYLAGEGGIYRSSDAGETWRTALAAPTLPASHQGLRVAVSSADPALVYAATGLFSGAAAWRSVDAGASWTRLRDLQGTLCTWTFPVVAPDPSVRERVFLSYGCLAGRNTSSNLTVSEDQWTTDGSPLLVPSARNDDALGYLYPQAAAFTADRQRGVVLAVRDQRLGGSALARTDDGGRTWRAVLNYAPSLASGRQVGPNVVLGGLATGGPTGGPGEVGLDTLFVGLGRDGQGVLGSADGGATWRRVGHGAVGAVRSVAWDASSAVLYAGTERGLWRLSDLSWPPAMG